MDFQKSLLSCLILSGVYISASHAQTLQEAIQLTINENPEVQEARAVRLAYEQEIDQAKSKYLPTLDVSAAYGMEQANNPATRTRGDGTNQLGRTETDVQLKQMVFDGFLTPHEVSRFTAKTDAQAFTVFGQSEIIGLQGTQAYINVLRRQALFDLAKTNLDAHKGMYEQIRLRTQRGIGRKSDLDQATGRLARAESNLQAERGNLTDSQTNYLRTIGVTPNQLSEPPVPTKALPTSMEEATELALANHPTLKAANADIVESLAQHNSASAPFYPNVNVVVDYANNNSVSGITGRTEDLQAMAKISYNLFNGGKDKARRNQTAYEMYQAKNIRDNTYRQVVESMRLAWVAYKTIGSQLDFFKAHMDASIKTLDAYKKQFNIGQRTLLDLLDTTNETYLASLAYTDAKYSELTARYRLLAGMGRLNKYLGVTLPAEIKPITPETQPSAPIITAAEDTQQEKIEATAPDKSMELLEEAKPEATTLAALPESQINPIPVAPLTDNRNVPTASDNESEIKQRLNDWAETWTQGNFDKYVNFYKADYRPDLTTSHEAWKKVRKSRVQPTQGIRVTLSDIKVTEKDTTNNFITTVFKQSYKSKKFKDVTTKTIVWEKVNGSWLIQEESTN